MLHKARTATLDLNTASSLLLNMFHVCTSMTDDLRTKVKPWKRLKINRNLLLGPLALFICQQAPADSSDNAHSTKLISLNLLGFTATESTFINQVGEFLLHKFLDLLDGLFEAALARARNMKVEGRIL
jgi:hypothetical protein